MADPQRQRLYRAENVLAQREPRLSLEECQAFVDKVVSSRWWDAHCPASRRYARVIVKPGRSNSRTATSYFDEITLPPWARNRYIILHELAHTMTPRSTTLWEKPAYSLVVASHGPAYAKNLLCLVERFMGKEDVQILRASFKERKVRWITRSK